MIANYISVQVQHQLIYVDTIFHKDLGGITHVESGVLHMRNIAHHPAIFSAAPAIAQLAQDLYGRDGRVRVTHTSPTEVNKPSAALVILSLRQWHTYFYEGFIDPSEIPAAEKRKNEPDHDNLEPEFMRMALDVQAGVSPAPRAQSVEWLSALRLQIDRAQISDAITKH